MAEDSEKKQTILSFNKRNVISWLIALAVLALAILIIQLLNKPTRSVENYCKVYAGEKTRLKSFPGSAYPSGVFNEELSDASQFATSFSRLEKVAPDEIKSDVLILKSAYQRMHDDSAQALSASLSAASADDSLKNWTKTRCVIQD